MLGRIYKVLIIGIFLIIASLIAMHGEMTQDKYGVISREEGNSLDNLIIFFIILFFLTLIVHNYYAKF